MGARININNNFINVEELIMENVKIKVAFSCAKIKKVQQQSTHCETD